MVEARDCAEQMLSQHDANYPKIRGLSQQNFIAIIKDDDLSSYMFSSNSIIVGCERLTPTFDNCNENVFFDCDILYAVPASSITALASCTFTSLITGLFMQISLHGVVTAETAAAFVLWFITQSTKYSPCNSKLCIDLHNLTELDSNLIVKEMQCMPFYKDDFSKQNCQAIGLDVCHPSVNV